MKNLTNKTLAVVVLTFGLSPATSVAKRADTADEQAMGTCSKEISLLEPMVYRHDDRFELHLSKKTLSEAVPLGQSQSLHSLHAVLVKNPPQVQLLDKDTRPPGDLQIAGEVVFDAEYSVGGLKLPGLFPDSSCPFDDIGAKKNPVEMRDPRSQRLADSAPSDLLFRQAHEQQIDPGIDPEHDSRIVFKTSVSVQSRDGKTQDIALRCVLNRGVLEELTGCRINIKGDSPWDLNRRPSNKKGPKPDDSKSGDAGSTAPSNPKTASPAGKK